MIHIYIYTHYIMIFQRKIHGPMNIDFSPEAEFAGVLHAGFGTPQRSILLILSHLGVAYD